MDARAHRRLEWVDIAKAISITLVVMMHATFGVGEATGDVGFMHTVLAFAAPFRMPEFFLISGLFLSSVIARPWRHYADRRVVHYFYFYALWAVILIGFKHLVVDRDPVGAATMLVSALWEPYSVLWFIYALAVFSLIAKLAWQARVPGWALFAAAAVLSILPIETPISIVNYTAEYLVYFVAGAQFAPAILDLAERVASRPLLAVVGLVAWAAVNAAVVFGPAHLITPTEIITGASAFPGTTFVLAILGAVAVCTTAVLLTRTPLRIPLVWVGAHSLVIYLSFVLPMGIFRTLLLALTPQIDTGLASLLVLVVALVSPLIVYAIIARIGFGRFLFERPEWVRLPGAPAPLAQPAE